MANPFVPQGTLNRLRANVQFPFAPELNITASFLSPEGIDLTFTGDGTLQIPTMTGTAQSQEPYQMCTATIHLNKTQGLADAFKDTLETDSNLGPMSIFGDTAALSEYDIVNCGLKGIQDIKFNGTTIGYSIRIEGTYYINSALWDQ